MQEGNRASRCKASPAQINYLAEFMKSHTDLASGLGQTLQGRVTCEALWQKLTAELNALGGAIKTVAKWKQAWRDMRNNVKKKAAHNRSEFRGYGPGSTGNGPPTLNNLTPVEEQVFSVMGPVAVFGLEGILSTELTEVSPIPPMSPILPTPELPRENPLPVLPEPATSSRPAAASNPRTRKRKRIATRVENFDMKLFKIEEEKLHLKRERNCILNRMVDVLHEISNKLENK